MCTFDDIKTTAKYDLEYLTDELSLFRYIYYNVFVMVDNMFTNYEELEFEDYCLFTNFYTYVFTVIHDDMKAFKKDKLHANSLSLDYLKNKFKITKFILEDKYDIVNGKFTLDFYGYDKFNITLFLGMKDDADEKH